MLLSKWLWFGGAAESGAALGPVSVEEVADAVSRCWSAIDAARMADDDSDKTDASSVVSAVS